MLEIRVTNTLTGRKEPFRPLSPGMVKMYVCGPTVYDYTHVGHARTYVAFDVIKRYLRLRGFDVLHVQNITDIDDKIIRRGAEEGRDWREIAEEYTRDYLEVLSKLRIEVHLHPRVTHHIGEIIEFIQDLVDKGYAYVSNGSVYFEVDKYPHYGALSGRFHREEWRQEEDVLREKKKPYDFALWKRARPGEPWWESPWGPGRPGWHIECSVMSTRYLGDRFDIHGGGQDLIFPHHENERAQSEARIGGQWVRYWLHTGMITVHGEKMSKSLGNIVSLREVFKKWRPEILRLWLLSAHYRSQLDFAEEGLMHAERLYERMVNTVWLLRNLLREAEPSYKLSDTGVKTLRSIEEAYAGFHRAMSDDFNTPQALSHIGRILTLTNRELAAKPEHATVLRAYQVLREVNQVLGVLDDAFKEAGVEEERFERLVKLIVKVRQKHREAKDYETADWIRSELANLGIRLMDRKDKTTWVIEPR